MVDDYIVDKVLEKIKDIIGINRHTKILIETDNKLPDGITLKKFVILITCVIKDDDKLYPQLFLEEALVS